MNSNNWQIRIIQVLAVIGILLAFYLYLFHEGVLFLTCSTEGAFDCGKVSGPYAAYAKFFGIPVALLGMVGYVSMFAVIWLRDWFPSAEKLLRNLLFALIVIALGFSAYLAYLEEFVIGAWCQYCLYSAAVVVTMFILSLWNIFGRKKPKDST